MASEKPFRPHIQTRIDPKDGKRKAIGKTFYCQNCGATYLDCKCGDYQSAYATGRTRW